MKEKTEFERFSDTTKRLMSVSKEEFNRREAEWKKQREQRPKAKKRNRAGSSQDRA